MFISNKIWAVLAVLNFFSKAKWVLHKCATKVMTIVWTLILKILKITRRVINSNWKSKLQHYNLVLQCRLIYLILSFQEKASSHKVTQINNKIQITLNRWTFMTKILLKLMMANNSIIKKMKIVKIIISKWIYKIKVWLIKCKIMIKKNISNIKLKTLWCQMSSESAKWNTVIINKPNSMKIKIQIKLIKNT